MEGERERQKQSGWRLDRKKEKKTQPKTHKGKEECCLQGSSIFFITMQRYRSSTVIKVSLTVVLQAVYRYSNRARQSRRNLEDKVKDNHKQRQNVKCWWVFCFMKLTIIPTYPVSDQ